MESILLVGAYGHIGSYLHAVLVAASFIVIAIDPLSPENSRYCRDVTDDELAQIEIVIFLGGYSNSAACNATTAEDVQQRNVIDIANLARRMRPEQRLLFASTCAVLEGSGSTQPDESWNPEPHQLDRYATSMWNRETTLSTLSQAQCGPRCLGVRFGLALGCSRYMRHDLLPIVFVQQALHTGVIRMHSPQVARAVLALSDLADLVLALLGDRNWPAFSIVHAASFNTTIGEIAAEVAQQTGAPIEMTQPPSQAIGWSADSSLISNRYHCFHQTLPSCVTYLLEHREMLQ